MSSIFEENSGNDVSVNAATAAAQWRTISVRKKKTPTTTGGAGGCPIGKFDEYIQKSGLEPKIYQREGVEFCLRREEAKKPILGGIIADEMGLGKTIVMMGLIIANLAMYRRTLIVVPVALIAQWVAQIKKTIIDTGVNPDLSILVYHGYTGKRRVVLSNDEGSSVWCHRPPKRGGGGGGAIDIVITTYGCVAMEEPIIVRRKGVSSASASVSAVKTPSLLTFRADRVIFDEAHHLRNKSSRVFKGAMRVVGGGDAANGRSSVWIVTGTPIQNKISDLKSLCYILGFKVSELITEERRKFIRDNYVLRRTKVSVGMVAAAEEAGAEASDDTASMTYCMPASSSSRLQSLAHYRTNVPWTSVNELDLSREIHQKAKNTTDRAERLKLYTQMRQMCVWPALLRRSGGGGGGGGVSHDDSYGLSIDEFHVAVSKQSKMDRVVATMTAEVTSAPDGERRKSIVFCHYRREMTQLRDMLLMHGGGGYEEDDVAIIDGSVGPRQRAHIFASAPSVLILQIRTCSEGLNLQEYSNVYFISPHWNPCVEDQAIARCYRMGQTSQVRVFRFYMADFVGEFDAVIPGESECISTLDHRCEEIQEKKRILCNEFLLG
jgi:SNF2 family DNA or RNA helicase